MDNNRLVENLGKALTMASIKLDMPVLEILKKFSNDYYIPLSALTIGLTRKQAVVKFLIENYSFKITDVANLLGKTPSTVWACLKKANNRHPEKIEYNSKDEFIAIGEILNIKNG